MNDSPSDFLRSDLRQCDSLDDYLAGELSLDGRSEFENHLERCPSCLVAVDEWRELCQALRTATIQLEVPSRSLLKASTLSVLHRRFTLEERKSLLRAVFSRIEVADRAIVGVTLNPPFSLFFDKALRKRF